MQCSTGSSRGGTLHRGRAQHLENPAKCGAVPASHSYAKRSLAFRKIRMNRIRKARKASCRSESRGQCTPEQPCKLASTRAQTSLARGRLARQMMTCTPGECRQKAQGMSDEVEFGVMCRSRLSICRRVPTGVSAAAAARAYRGCLHASADSRGLKDLRCSAANTRNITKQRLTGANVAALPGSGEPLQTSLATISPASLSIAGTCRESSANSCIM